MKMPLLWKLLLNWKAMKCLPNMQHSILRVVAGWTKMIHWYNVFYFFIVLRRGVSLEIFFICAICVPIVPSIALQIIRRPTINIVSMDMFSRIHSSFLSVCSHTVWRHWRGYIRGFQPGVVIPRGSQQHLRGGSRATTCNLIICTW